MKTTLGFLITAPISNRLRPARLRRGARTVFGGLTLALLGTGLAGVARAQVVTEFPIPTPGGGPDSIVLGTDGNLWFTEGGGNKIGRISSAGDITEFDIPTPGSGPRGIDAGADGNLWFTENGGNKIGRISTSGIVTEFPIPTAAAGLWGIAAGPDGNLWFTEYLVDRIGRVTTSGAITEFHIPTPPAGPARIAAGPDGALWFTENNNQIGRITTAGTITEFPAGAYPQGITAGPDGNLWFTEYVGDKIGRITPEGTVTEFPVPAPAAAPSGIATGPDGDIWFTESSPFSGNAIGRIGTAGVEEFPLPTAQAQPICITAGPDGNLWFTEGAGNNIGRITTAPITSHLMAVDAQMVFGSSSNANGVLEPGETVQVDPSWKNTLTDPQTFTGTASNLAGPAGLYAINDSSADYGTLSGGTIGDCNGTGDCYLMTVSGARPAVHWDATFTENLSSDSISTVHTLHIGGSFTDVNTDIAVDPYYPSIEAIFHNQVSAGCQDGTVFCPTSPTTRQEMAVFLLKASQGSGFHVPACAGIFSDVPCTPGVGFPDWIENLSNRGITAGCQAPGDPPTYCPTREVLRSEMAVFLLKASQGSAYDPPDCAGIFSDVPCTPGVGFPDWIEDLYNRGVTSGCQAPGDPLMYCPDRSVLRQEMAVFLVKMFGLQLYGP